jgi:hypothetical protein
MLVVPLFFFRAVPAFVVRPSPRFRWRTPMDEQRGFQREKSICARHDGTGERCKRDRTHC